MYTFLIFILRFFALSKCSWNFVTSLIYLFIISRFCLLLNFFDLFLKILFSSILVLFLSNRLSGQVFQNVIISQYFLYALLPVTCCWHSILEFYNYSMSIQFIKICSLYNLDLNFNAFINFAFFSSVKWKL